MSLLLKESEIMKRREVLESLRTRCGHCQGTGVHTIDGFCWWCQGTGVKEGQGK